MFDATIAVDDEPTLTTAISYPLIIQPKLPPITGWTITAAIPLLAMAIVLQPWLSPRTVGLFVFGGMLPVMIHAYTVLSCRVTLTSTHADIIAVPRGGFRIRRERLLWSGILTAQDISVKRERWYLSMVPAIVLKTPTVTYSLPKALWPDAEWIANVYQQQTGRAVKRVTVS